jgi:uncharacterized protein
MPNILLKELYIDNFKSFKDSKFEFGKVNCLIAPNNAGKSNLVEVLDIINKSIFLNDNNSLLQLVNGFNYRYDERDIIIQAKFDVYNIAFIDNMLFKYEFEFIYIMHLNDNTVAPITQINGKIKAINIDKKDIKSNLELKAYNNNITNYINFYDDYLEKLNKKNYKKFKNLDDNELILKLSKFEKNNLKNQNKVILNIFGVKSFNEVFYFHPQTIKKQQNYETDFLLKDGTNLAYFLNTLDEDTFNDISTSLIGEVELIESIEILNGAIPTIIFNENSNGNIKPLIQQKVSDGTINFLAIMTALYGSKSNCLIFEEPERHMHMQTLSYILNTMRDTDKQIFFTTHSSEILEQLKLDEIIFLFRDYNGDTKGQRAKDIPNIKNFMKQYKNDLIGLVKLGIIGEYEE